MQNVEDFELLEMVREVEVNIWNSVYENERYFYPESSYTNLPEGDDVDVANTIITMFTS